jgi:citronellyl-CoA dehydrogenase
MPALVAGIHDFLGFEKQDVDGRDKPGHDGIEDFGISRSMT